jgi:putative transposase
MSDYRRYFVPGGSYFFTLATADRLPLFRSAEARKLLGRFMREACCQAPFATVAIVLLPDHLHAIWTLPGGDDDYSGRWQAIKANFTREWLKQGAAEAEISDGYQRQRRRGIWQPRFIEHTIRDERDLHHHADYLHYNPLKHGCVSKLKDWPWSSFHRYVHSGDYPENWGSENCSLPDFSGVNADLLE